MTGFPKDWPDTLHDYSSFTDESSITGHRYMVIGGVTCRTAESGRIHETMAAIRAKSRFPTDSLQWKHYRDVKWDDYKMAVDYFLDMNDRKSIDFSCLIIDTRQLDHGKFNDSDPETFFQKMINEHVSSLVRKYQNSTFRLFHGHRESKFDLLEVRTTINSTIAKHQYRLNHRPLKQLDYLRVEHSGPHQLADILLGAVSFYWNAGLRKGGTSRKRRLAAYIHSECCAGSLSEPTPYSLPHFDIWKLRLRGDPRA